MRRCQTVRPVVLSVPKRSGTRIPVLVLCLTTPFTTLFAQEPASVSKDVLTARARQRQDAVSTMAVSFTRDQTDGPTETVIGGRTVSLAFVFSHFRVAQNGEQILLEHTFSGDPYYNGDLTGTRWAAYDGQYGTRYTARSDRPGGNLVIFDSGPDVKNNAGIAQDLSTFTTGYFDIQLLYPPNEGSGINDLSLVSLLESKYSSIRSSTEPVDGVACHVIDLRDPDSSQILMSAWIDTNRGVLPVRIRSYNIIDENTTECLIEKNVTEAVEVSKGIWLATAGTRRVFETTATRGTPEREWTVTVDQYPDGTPMLTVGKQTPVEDFQLWLHVPAGTDCFVESTGEEWIAGAEDIEGIASNFLASVSHRSTNSSFDYSSVSEQQTVRAGFLSGWSVLMSCSITAAVLALITYCRRR